jgi:hypothetical protein
MSGSEKSLISFQGRIIRDGSLTGAPGAQNKDNTKPIKVRVRAIKGGRSGTGTPVARASCTPHCRNIRHEEW